MVRDRCECAHAMRVMLDPLDFNADLSTTAEHSDFYFSCMRAADLYLYF